MKDEDKYLAVGYFLSLRQMKFRYAAIGFCIACWVIGMVFLPFMRYIGYLPLILSLAGVFMGMVLTVWVREKSPEQWAEIVRAKEERRIEA